MDIRSPRDTPRAAPSTELRDRHLMDRICAGDEDAFRSLCRHYGPIAGSLVSSILGQPSTSHGVTEDVFRAVWQRTERYDPGRGSVRSWLMDLVHRRAVDQKRGQGAPALARTEPEASSSQVPPSADLTLHGRAVRAALGRLPAEQARVIELMYLQGLTLSEVAERLGTSVAAAGTTCVQGMKSLRQELTPSSSRPGAAEIPPLLGLVP